MSCSTHPTPSVARDRPQAYWIRRSPAAREEVYESPRSCPRPLPAVPTSAPSDQYTSMMLWDDEDATLNELPGRALDHLLSLFTALFDVSCLDVLDNRLLASPLDCFADLCYKSSIGDSDPRQPGPSYAGVSSWHRALSPASPTKSLPGLDDEPGFEDDSDSDSEPDLLTPIQSHSAPDWGVDILSASDTEDARAIKFVHPSPLDPSQKVALQVPVPVRRCVDVDAELALLFSSSPPPDPSHSVHYFPTWPDGQRPKRQQNMGARIRSLAGLRVGRQ